MENQRKMKCFECDGNYSLKKTKLKYGIVTDAYVCNNCNDIVFSKEQAKKYMKFLNLKEAADAKRKIIRIGSSMGITLPEGLRKFGVRIGRKVKLEAIDKKTIKISLI